MKLPRQFLLTGLAVFALFGSGLANSAISAAGPAPVQPVWVDFSVFDDRVVALAEDGQVYAWGYNPGSLSGLGPAWEDFWAVSSPQLVQFMPNLGSDKIKQVATGTYHTLALTNDGKILAWGANYSGQLGLGHFDEVDQPEVVNPAWFNGRTIAKVYAGWDVSFALATTGELFVWGENEGCLQTSKAFLPAVWQPEVPTMLAAAVLPPIENLSVAGNHVLALTTTGEVYSWGVDAIHSGSVCNPELVNLPSIMLPVTQVAAGGASFAITAGNDVIDLRTPATAPVLTGLGTGATMAVGGGPWADGYDPYHLMVTEAGALSGLGLNSSGQLGLGHYAPLVFNRSAVPGSSFNPPLQSGETVSKLYAENTSTFALTSLGRLYSWGYNEYDTLGLGGFAPANRPTLVQVLDDPPPAYNPTLKISGTVAIGSTLTATVSGVPAGPDWDYYLEWSNSAGEWLGDSPTYKVQATDAGQELWVTVWVSGPGYFKFLWAETKTVPSPPKPKPPAPKPPAPKPPAPKPPAPKPPVPKPAAKGMVQLVLSPSLNGAAYGDVLAVDRAGVLWRATGSASGRLANRVKLGKGWANQTVYAPGDWNQDGKADLVAVTKSGKMMLYPGNGKGGLGKGSEIGHGWSKYTVIPAGDLTGDGFNDMLAINKQTGVLLLYSGNGKGGFKPGYRQVGHGWKNMQLFPAGDLNKDGKTDILGLKADGKLLFYAGRGDGTFKPSVQVGHGWKGLTLVAGADINGDKIADIVSRAPNGTLNLYKGKGGGTFAKPSRIGNGY